MKKFLAAAGVGAALTVGGLAGISPAHADFVFNVCGSGLDGVVAGTPTSCPFADNVRASYFSYGGPMVQAWSPVTEQYYMMDCSNGNYIAHLAYGGTHPAVLCTGGNDAAVVVF
jgi:hypothetical protein